jgi:hypothetical protein
MNLNREEVYSALFNVLDSLRVAGQLRTTSRRLKHIEQTDVSEFPCGHQVQQDENARAQGKLPTVWTLNAEWWLYVQDSGDVALSTLLNPLLDKVTVLLDPETPLTLNTLSGRVYNANVSGTVEVIEGVLGDRALAIVPIRIVYSGVND